jgi:hypothetical protein
MKKELLLLSSLLFVLVSCGKSGSSLMTEVPALTLKQGDNEVSIYKEYFTNHNTSKDSSVTLGTINTIALNEDKDKMVASNINGVYFENVLIFSSSINFESISAKVTFFNVENENATDQRKKSAYSLVDNSFSSIYSLTISENQIDTSIVLKEEETYAYAYLFIDITYDQDNDVRYTYCLNYAA